MNHNTILITRHLSPEDARNLREKLGQMWPGERFTIVYGELLTAEDVRRAWAGPTEWKDEDTDATPVPRFVS